MVSSFVTQLLFAGLGIYLKPWHTSCILLLSTMEASTGRRHFVSCQLGSLGPEHGLSSTASILIPTLESRCCHMLLLSMKHVTTSLFKCWLEVRGRWHFLLWHILKCSHNEACYCWHVIIQYHKLMPRQGLLLLVIMGRICLSVCSLASQNRPHALQVKLY